MTDVSHLREQVRQEVENMHQRLDQFLRAFHTSAAEVEQHHKALGLTAPAPVFDAAPEPAPAPAKSDAGSSGTSQPK